MNIKITGKDVKATDAIKVYLDNSNKTHEFTLPYIKGSYDLSEYLEYVECDTK